MTPGPLARALVVALAALACGAVSSVAAHLAMSFPFGGWPVEAPEVEQLLGLLAWTSRAGLVCALPAAVVAPVLVRGARLWPVVPLTFLVPVCVSVVVGPLGPLTLLGLGVPLAYLAGLGVLVTLARRHPRGGVARA